MFPTVKTQFVLPKFVFLFAVVPQVLLFSIPRAAEADDLFFQEKIAPIFQSKCVSCHNDNDLQGELSLQSVAGMRKGGESGEVVVAGQPEESSLWHSISGSDPEMPKDSEPLTKKEIELIEKWIKQGASWPKNVKLSYQTSVDMNWWSLKELRDSRKLTIRQNPIDYFIQRKIKEHRLSVAAEADRRTLIRRLYFDLIGLPPTPEQIQEFVNSTDPKAYAKLVDSLLASNRYGEKWARHWLDVVQYGETHGYDKDKLRMNAWPYRDYVIRSFNQDKPYSRFVREQLAGDVLWPGTPDGVVATGFIAAGPWDFIGHAEVPESKIDGQVARNLDRDNMVTSTMNTFCSLTVQCARCHNHKLDPVSMEDYYRLQAVFAAIDRADRSYDRDPETAKRRNELTQRKSKLEQQLAEVESRIAKRKTKELLELEQRVAQLSRKVSQSVFPKTQLPKSNRLGYHSQVASQPTSAKWVQVDLGRSVPIDAVILMGASEYGFDDFGFPHRFVVECSNDPEFQTKFVLADHRDADFERPGALPVVLDGREAGATGKKARYVRVTATRLWNRRVKGQPTTNDWIFALGEMSVVSLNRMVNITAVRSLDSIEAHPSWSRANLVDHFFGDHDLETKLGRKESPTNGFHSSFAAVADTEKWVQIDLASPQKFDSICFLPAYPTDFKDTPGFGFPVRFKVEVSNDSTFMDAHTVVDHTQSDFDNPFTKPVCFDSASQEAFQYVRLTATRLWNRGDPGGKNHALALGECLVYSEGTNLAKGATVTASDSINSGRWHQKFLVDGFSSRLAVGAGSRFLMQVGRDSDLGVELSAAQAKLRRQLLQVLGSQLIESRNKVQQNIQRVTTEINRLPKPGRVYAGTVHRGSGSFRGRAGLGPREIFVLHRGNVTQPKHKVRPGTVPFVAAVKPVFAIDDASPEGLRRVALANWIVRKDNPLTWRSIVNRVWQYHFGRGIVATSNDFGRGGSQPTHPELLDWLASEFRDGGEHLEKQSIKSLHRLICLSRTYRQTSLSNAHADVDRGNRFLWRMNRRRLSAEEIHDSVLQVTGLLNLKMGGPSYQDFVIQRPEHSPHYEYHLYDPLDKNTHRRAIYRMIVRSQPQPFLDTLDCADPSFSVPKRAETLTALQALGMLNNRFMVSMSEQFAARLERDEDSGTARIKAAYEALTGRRPDSEEIKLLLTYHQQHGLKNLSRVLFNLNEFVFVD